MHNPILCVCTHTPNGYIIRAVCKCALLFIKFDGRHYKSMCKSVCPVCTLLCIKSECRWYNSIFKSVSPVELSWLIPVTHSSFEPQEPDSVIYECRCDECGKLYDEETERCLGEKAQEHDRSVKEGDLKTALSQHQVMTGHKVLSKPVIEGFQVIDQEPRNLHRKGKETIHIKL